MLYYLRHAGSRIQVLERSALAERRHETYLFLYLQGRYLGSSTVVALVKGVVSIYSLHGYITVSFCESIIRRHGAACTIHHTPKYFADFEEVIISLVSPQQLDYIELYLPGSTSALKNDALTRSFA